MDIHVHYACGHKEGQLDQRMVNHMEEAAAHRHQVFGAEKT